MLDKFQFSSKRSCKLKLLLIRNQYGRRSGFIPLYVYIELVSDSVTLGHILCNCHARSRYLRWFQAISFSYHEIFLYWFSDLTYIANADTFRAFLTMQGIEIPFCPIMFRFKTYLYVTQSPKIAWQSSSKKECASTKASLEVCEREPHRILINSFECLHQVM